MKVKSAFSRNRGFCWNLIVFYFFIFDIMLRIGPYLQRGLHRHAYFFPKMHFPFHCFREQEFASRMAIGGEDGGHSLAAFPEAGLVLEK